MARASMSGPFCFLTTRRMQLSERLYEINQNVLHSFEMYSESNVRQ